MKLRRLLWPFATIALIALALGLFTNLFGRQLIAGLPMVQLQRVKRFATSSITLESVRELYAFQTVRYVHRAVFPYDYLPPDVSLNTILRKLRTSDRTVRDTLTPDEHLYFRTWNLASDIDLSTTGGTFDFVVVSLVITAGLDVNTGAEELTVTEFAREDGQRGRRATLVLAPPAITEIAVEDIDRDNYPYPDISIGADAWRRVADFVRAESVSDTVRREIVETARENGEDFLVGVLQQAGFDEVVIRYAVPSDEE